MYQNLSDPEAIGKVISYIEELLDEAGVPLKTANRVNLAADEIITNIVSYSGGTGAEITCEIRPEKILLIFEDDGMMYDPLQAREPDIKASAEERQIGGLGIFLTRKMMSRISYQRTGDKNRLQLELDR